MTGSAPPRRGVLVVEDDAAIRDLLCVILEDLGLRPIVVGSGRAALEALRAGPVGDVALAIVDLVLDEGESGLAVLRALRAARPGLAGIISTGHDARMMEKGCALEDVARTERFELLVKPFRVDQLSDAIARALAPPPTHPESGGKRGQPT